MVKGRERERKKECDEGSEYRQYKHQQHTDIVLATSTLSCTVLLCRTVYERLSQTRSRTKTLLDESRVSLFRRRDGSCCIVKGTGLVVSVSACASRLDVAGK